MSGDIQFNGTPEEWAALVKKNNMKQAEKPVRKPRKDTGVKRKRKTKRDPNMTPIWTNQEGGGIKQVQLPARLRWEFIERFGLKAIPNEAELVGWIELHKA
jgi:hypothetical protein